MSTQAIVAIVIFAVTYVGILVNRIHKTVAALLGAMAMIILRLVSDEQAFAAIDLNVIFLLKRRAVKSHHRIPQIFIKRPPMLEDHIGKLGENGVEGFYYLVGGMGFCEPCEAAQVGKQNGNELSVSSQLEVPFWISKDHVRQFCIHVAVQHLVQEPVAVFQFIVKAFIAK